MDGLGGCVGGWRLPGLAGGVSLMGELWVEGCAGITPVPLAYLSWYHLYVPLVYVTVTVPDVPTVRIFLRFLVMACSKPCLVLSSCHT